MSAPSFRGIPIGGKAFFQPSKLQKDGLTGREWKVICGLTAISFLILRMRFLQQTHTYDSIQYDQVHKKEVPYSSHVKGLTSGGEAAEKWVIQNPPAYVTHAPRLNVVTLPPAFDNFMNVTQSRMVGETPYFWSIPVSGGGTVQHIIAACLGLTLASDGGARDDGHGADNFLQVLWIDGKKHVNVDMTTPEGIGRAKNLGLIESKMADVIVSGEIYDIVSLLDAQQTNIRMFTMMRHPVERAVSYFYWAKNHDEHFSNFSIRDFFLRSEFSGNWATRKLVNKMTGTLYLEDLDLAKYILKQKCLVGLLTHKAASMKRFKRYFGWQKLAGIHGSSECEERSMFWGWQNKNDHPFVKEGTEEYKLIYARNEFDIELYEYALELFEEQGRMMELEEKAYTNTITEETVLEEASKDKNVLLENVPIEPIVEKKNETADEHKLDEEDGDKQGD